MAESEQLAALREEFETVLELTRSYRDKRDTADPGEYTASVIVGNTRAMHHVIEVLASLEQRMAELERKLDAPG